MKSAVVLAAALVMSLPVVSRPTVADAQVLVGRGGSAASTRRARPAPPRLTEAEENQLWDAESEIETIDDQIADVRAAGETQGGLTIEQQAYLDAQAARRNELQVTVTRLEAKKNR